MEQAKIFDEAIRSQTRMFEDAIKQYSDSNAKKFEDAIKQYSDSNAKMIEEAISRQLRILDDSVKRQGQIIDNAFKQFSEGTRRMLTNKTKRSKNISRHNVKKKRKR